MSDLHDFQFRPRAISCPPCDGFGLMMRPRGQIPPAMVCGLCMGRGEVFASANKEGWITFDVIRDNKENHG